MTENEIAAANTVQWEYLNAQGQPKIYWPATFHLAKAYVDQLDRDGELSDTEIMDMANLLLVQKWLMKKQASMLEELSMSVSAKAANSANPTKVSALAEALKNLAG